MPTTTPSKLLLDKTNIVLNHVTPNADGSKTVDPIAIATLIYGILSDVFKECRNKPDVAQSAIENPKYIQRLRLRRYVRKSLGDKLYNEKGEEILTGLYDLGKNVTGNELKQLIDEVNSNKS